MNLKEIITEIKKESELIPESPQIPKEEKYEIFELENLITILNPIIFKNKKTALKPDEVKALGSAMDKVLNKYMPAINARFGAEIELGAVICAISIKRTKTEKIKAFFGKIFKKKENKEKEGGKK